MSSPQHDHHEHQLGRSMPCPRETVRRIRQPNTNAHAPISRNDFKDDVEDRVGDRIRVEVTGFDGRDYEDGEHKPPYVVG